MGKSPHIVPLHPVKELKYCRHFKEVSAFIITPDTRTSQAGTAPGSFSFRLYSLSLGRERARVRVVHHAKQPPHSHPLPRQGARDVPGT
jgi:hypothetical protein